MSFKPRVDPFDLEPDRATSSDACVVNLATLARSVDRVPAHAGILRSLRDVQPDLHRELLSRRLTIGQPSSVGLLPLAADALSNGRECTARQYWFNASIVENVVLNRIGPEAWVRTEGAFPTDGDAFHSYSRPAL
jgi:hypothetical protein